MQLDLFLGDVCRAEIALFAALTRFRRQRRRKRQQETDSGTVSFALSRSAAIKTSDRGDDRRKADLCAENVQTANGSAQSERSFRLPRPRALRNARTIISVNATETSVYNSEVQ